MKLLSFGEILWDVYPDEKHKETKGRFSRLLFIGDKGTVPSSPFYLCRGHTETIY